MALNVRVTQIGQTAVNKPFFEVLYNGRRYVARTNDDGKIEFVSPVFLKSLGVNSLVHQQFYQPDSDVLKLFKTSSGITELDTRFAYVTLGSGLGFITEFSPLKGFSSLAISNALWQTL